MAGTAEILKLEHKPTKLLNLNNGENIHIKSERLRDRWVYNKRSNIRVIGIHVMEGEENKDEPENLPEEIMAQIPQIYQKI